MAGIAENEVPAGPPTYYPDYVAQTHTTTENVDASGFPDGWSRPVLDVPEDADALDVLRAHRAFRDAGFQAHFYQPPESIDDPDPESEISQSSEGIQLEMICSRWAMFANCEEGHTYAKEVICNREWCSECGGKDGKAHQRRKAKWLPRLRQMASIGYMVITIPPELREGFRDKQQLRDFGISIKRLMQREGFSRGLRRYHWFGEDHQGEDGEQAHGDGLPPFHPHLNILLEAGWIDEICPDEDKASGDGCRGPGKCLSRIKRSVARILSVELARVNLHYEYAKTIPEMLHVMNYVLRPTFTHKQWDEPLTDVLYKFRHSLKWGKWEDDPVWDVPASENVPSPYVESLVHGRCPIDGTPITWNSRVTNKLILLRGKELELWREIGEGYWEWTGQARAAPS